MRRLALLLGLCCGAAFSVPPRRDALLGGVASFGWAGFLGQSRLEVVEGAAQVEDATGWAPPSYNSNSFKRN